MAVDAAGVLPGLMQYLPTLQRGLLALLSLVALLACGEPSQRVVLSGETMGTYYRLTLLLDSDSRAGGIDAAVLEQRVSDRLQSLSETFSTYIPDSELSRYNGLQAPVCQAVSGDLASVVALSLRMHERSAGAFNPALGPVIARWGFDSAGRGPDWQPPGEQELAGLLASTDLGALALGPDGQLCKTRDLALNFSAIAKGYGVDALAEWLDELGLEHYLVDIGGELRARGSNPDGLPWRLAVEQPVVASGQVLEVLEPGNSAVATSGDYRNYIDHAGQRFGHTIDPRNGRPVSHGLRSVTVVSDSAAEADAWATALMVLGPGPGASLARELGLAVLLVEDDTTASSPDGYRRWHSPAFEAFRPARGQ